MTTPAHRFRTFMLLLCAQFVSLLGSGLSAFALAIYVYQETGAATTLGFLLALRLLPIILASPFTGSIVDRWGAKPALIVANSGAMLITIILTVLLFTDSVAIWHFYVLLTALSALAALEFPAFASLLPQLVPEKHLGRANGMRVFVLATTEVLAPVAGGFLLLTIDIFGIVLLDFVSFGLAILTLCLVRIPRARGPVEERASGVASLLVEFREGWRYVAARRGLVALVVFLSAVNFAAGFIDLLITPLVLAFSSPEGLGTVMSIGGLGMIATSLAVSAWGGPRRRVRGLLLFSLVLAVATILGSARPNLALVAIAAFAFMGALGLITSTNQSIWQSKVESHMLGRALAIQNMVASVPMLLAYGVAGLAIDHVFEPFVGRDDVESPMLATLIGAGPGRGIALLMMFVGVLIALSVILAAMNPRLRHLEEEVPDVKRDDDEAVTEPAAEVAT